ncbi:hypothetical protein [Photobacterium damselae]|uniref:hypothetical protein n=1 Tax=Photobacterium damselae TaxID=38293 RepID=UPI0040686B75
MAVINTTELSFKKLSKKTQGKLLDILSIIDKSKNSANKISIGRINSILGEYDLDIKKMHDTTCKIHVRIPFVNEFEKRLARQIAWSLGIHTCLTTPKDAYIYTCTPIQAAELQCRFTAYKEELKAEMESTLELFFKTQFIFPKNTNTNALPSVS